LWPGTKRFRNAAIALVRYGHVDDVAALVAFVAGPQSSFIIGATLTVDWRDGSLTARSGIALAMTGDLSRAAYMGAQATALSFARDSAQDSMPYRSELSIDWPVTWLRFSRAKSLSDWLEA